VLVDVRDYLARSAQTALDAGIRPDSIILDPGIGFGKLASHNLALMAGLDSIAALGYHLLVGISRKRVIGEITGKPVQDRLAGSLGAACAAWAGGATILRVHDVPQTVDALACFVSCVSGSVPECPES
jgi:dihydropteroate synthase